MKSNSRPSGTWEALGATDADWAVETRDERMHGGWEDAQAEFYATGARRLNQAYEHLGDLEEVRTVLDYGSGTGRLTFNLAQRFETVTAADISLSMLTELKKRADERNIGNLRLVDLAESTPPPDHDLAVCLITLQHIPDWDDLDRALRTIAQSLNDDGRAVLDFPTRPLSPRRRLQLKLNLYRALRLARVSHDQLHRRGLTGISMRFEAEAKFVQRLERAGLTLVSTRPWHGTYYDQVEYVVRRA